MGFGWEKAGRGRDGEPWLVYKIKKKLSNKNIFKKDSQSEYESQNILMHYVLHKVKC